MFYTNKAIYYDLRVKYIYINLDRKSDLTSGIPNLGY